MFQDLPLKQQIARDIASSKGLFMRFMGGHCPGAHLLTDKRTRYVLKIGLYDNSKGGDEAMTWSC